MSYLRCFSLVLSFVLLAIAVTAQDVTVRLEQLEISLPSPYTITSTSPDTMSIQLDGDDSVLTVRVSETNDALPTNLATIMNASRPEPFDYTKVSLNGTPTLVSDIEADSIEMLAVVQGVAYDLMLTPVSGVNPFIEETGSPWDTILSELAFVVPDDAPEFIQFETDITEVTRVPLDVNVAWDLLNRPDNSNLEFVQVLENGEEINVELPRDNPFIASAGSGVIRLATAGDNEEVIDLQVRLRDLSDNRILAIRQILLPADIPPVVVPTAVAVDAPTTEAPESIATGSDVITQFGSVVNLVEQTTTVTWEIAADAVEILRYQAVGSGGQAIIEILPSQISGTYTFAGEFEAVDETNIAVYGIGTLSAVVDGTQSVVSTTIRFEEDSDSPQITVFATTEPDTEINALPTQASITWAVINRPPETNLEFVQVLANDVLINAELPRDNPFIASSGSGLVNLVASTDFDLSQAGELTVRVRLLDSEGNVITSRDLIIPYTPPS